MTNGWNFADIWERVAARFPDAPAQITDERIVSWAEFNRRADGVAAGLIDAGLGRQDKVAHYLYNCPEFLEATFAMFKAALVPVNTNYRYGPEELEYLWTNADVAAVVFHGSFTEQCDLMRGRCPLVKLWIWIDDGTNPCPAWAVPYESLADSNAESMQTQRSPDDLVLMYTGGTTGYPKGVMWRQDDLLGSLDAGSKRPLPPSPGWDEFDERVDRPGPRHFPAAPLMHGTGAFNAMFALTLAGSIVTSSARHFDPTDLLDAIDRHQVKSISLVGDAFAKPILRALDAEPERWDISSLRIMISSGVIWSSETKQGLLRHNPRLILIDTLGSSEAISMASSTTTAESSPAATAKFRLGPNTKVLTEDGREVQPGSGETGRVALRGRTPVGYYKDPQKSAATFVEIDGQRWSMPGDWAEVEADGTLRLIGRGSQCINTGGEKVYPDEVEVALKTHPAVHDAAVVGVPDERFGEAVTALVVFEEGESASEDAVRAHVREHLAGYKVPKRVLVVDSLGRAVNGKLNYKNLTQRALDELGY